jgi:membrane protease YdiL (CAAX protease family)
MTTLADDQRRPWQRKAWVQVLAILLGVAPIYTMSILSHLSRDQPYTMNEIFFYTTVVGGIMIVVLLLLLRYLCRERIRDLNLKRGMWWQDVLGGVVLAALTLGLHNLLQDPLNRMFPREPMSGLGNFINGMAQNPWLFALFVGPVLWIGVAGFEELTRVFLLSRLWKIGPANAWRWFGVLLSAVLFGLSHVYQGAAGVVDTAINGLILAVYYLVFGRVFPLIISHYLYDAIQIVMVVLLIRRGVIQF